MTFKRKYIGVDLGGTHLRAAFVDSETGEISDFKQIPTLAREGHEAVIIRMAELIEEIVASSGIHKSGIGGVGIGVPGTLDLERGLVVFLPNLFDNWLNVPLQQKIKELVDLPTQILNDARAMTFGEWKFGAWG